jgi:hypothetical protein
MRTRAQATRDAALTRLRRVNRSLTVAAVVGTGVVVDVVARTPLGHASARTVAAATRTTTTTTSTSKSKSAPIKHRTVTPADTTPAVVTPVVTTPAVVTPVVTTPAVVTPVVTPAAAPTVVSGGS